MSFKFTCPICNSELECDDLLENKITECPLCHNEVVPVKTTTKKNIAATNNSSKIETESMQKKQEWFIVKDGNEQETSNSLKIFINEITSIQSEYDFKRPLLSKIFRILGGLYLALAIASFTIGFLVSLFSLFTRGNAGSGFPFLVGIIAAIGLIINSLFSFGISQVIDFIGKICFNSDKILEIMRWQNRYIQPK